eukprot:TRINITY_DN15978_c0_g1_i1.p3 TRINITY_DN15978_c0_g1~~TRINITY_DN15978_c0_g1_i1.p3  ORF type:complete len:150 (-),score=39.26 TRINITY_DN15978_c0_g1_i1:39-488(-)
MKNKYSFINHQDQIDKLLEPKKPQFQNIDRVHSQQCTPTNQITFNKLQQYFKQMRKLKVKINSMETRKEELCLKEKVKCDKLKDQFEEIVQHLQEKQHSQNLIQGKYRNVKEQQMMEKALKFIPKSISCLLYTSPSPRDRQKSRMPSSA